MRFLFVLSLAVCALARPELLDGVGHDHHHEHEHDHHAHDVDIEPETEAAGSALDPLKLPVPQEPGRVAILPPPASFQADAAPPPPAPAQKQRTAPVPEPPAPVPVQRTAPAPPRPARIEVQRIAPARRQPALPVEDNEIGEETEPRPYSFSYQAGRYKNHIDRTHTETRDADGVVTGSYEYLDPFKRVVKVDYTADANGFYPTVQGAVPQQPKESPEVAAAREAFFAMSARINAEHARIGEQHAALRAAIEAKKAREEAERLAEEQANARL